jgi:hypothetical protein
MIMDIQRKGLIGTLVGHAVLLACLVVVSTKADVQTNQVISGWLQAIGSVLAIVFAVIVANTQYLRAEEEKKKAAIEHCVKLSMQANCVEKSHACNRERSRYPRPHDLGEARGEGAAGQIAVAWTIRNRVFDGKEKSEWGRARPSR